MIAPTASPARCRQLDLACESLYHAHQRLLVAHACQRGCDEHEARDLVQELFLRVFRLGIMLSLHARPIEAQRHWLLRTLRWMLINLQRDRRRQRRGGERALESLDFLLDEGIDIAAGESPDALHDRQWAMHIIERGLLKLRATTKPSAWSVMEHALWGSGTSTGAQRVATHRARLRMRDFIRREAPFDQLLEATVCRN